MEKDIYIHLIIQSLKGTISDEDHRRLSDWLSASKENETFKHEFERSWELSKKGRKEIEVDTAQDFLKLKERIAKATASEEQTKQSEAVVKPMRNTRRLFMWAAASVTLLGIFWFLIESDSSPTKMALNTGVGESKTATLPDGTMVWLNERTTFELHQSFNESERKVILTGEAFFDVQSDPEKPFIIEMEEGRVQVLGTSFNVHNRKNEIEVQVEEGRVQLSDKLVEKKITLSAGDYGKYNASKKTISKEEKYSKNRLAWKNNSLIFEEMTLAEVANDLERYFGKRITVQSQDMNACSYGGYFPNPDLRKILSAISNTFEMELVNDNNGNYILKHGVCKN